MKPSDAFRPAVVGIAAAVLGACGGKANDARNPGDNTPLEQEVPAPSSAVASDTAIANPVSPMGDSSAKARGGTGLTGPTQGAPVGGSPAAARAASGDSTGRASRQ